MSSNSRCGARLDAIMNTMFWIVHKKLKYKSSAIVTRQKVRSIKLRHFIGVILLPNFYRNTENEKKTPLTKKINLEGYRCSDNVSTVGSQISDQFSHFVCRSSYFF